MIAPNIDQGPHIPILFEQNSMYNFTYDGIHNHLGNSNSSKPLNNTMKFDELVNNLIPSDQGGLSTQNPSSSSSSSASIFLGNFNLNEIVPQEQIHRQRLDSVIHPQPLMSIDPTVVVSEKTDWFKFPMGNSNFGVPEMGFESPDVGIGQSENQLGLPLAMSMVPVSSSDCPVSVRQKSLVTEEMMEKTIQRRQKRMIKNRESAARSRAKKQAYTNQLEHKVFHLRKTNSWLIKMKEVDKLLSIHSTSKPRLQLRRTSSATF